VPAGSLFSLWQRAALGGEDCIDHAHNLGQVAQDTLNARLVDQAPEHGPQLETVAPLDGKKQLAGIEGAAQVLAAELLFELEKSLHEDGMYQGTSLDLVRPVDLERLFQAAFAKTNTMHGTRP